jgi:hypothetical protein
MLLAQGKALPYFGGPKIFSDRDDEFLFPPPAAAGELLPNLWQQFLFMSPRSI